MLGIWPRGLAHPKSSSHTDPVLDRCLKPLKVQKGDVDIGVVGFCPILNDYPLDVKGISTAESNHLATVDSYAAMVK